MAMPFAPGAPGSSPTPPTDLPVGIADLRREVGAQLVGDNISVTEDALSWASFAHFVTRLKDDRGRFLGLPWHIHEWADLMQEERLLCLMAARDHGKSWTVYAYIAWRIWRHNRRSDGVLMSDAPDGNLDIVYVTASYPLALQRFERIKQFLTDNDHLFGDVLPRRVKGTPLAVIANTWSKTQFRLLNGVQMVVKSIGSSMRGLHPQLLVADDIVDDKNSATEAQREKVWKYVTGVLMPMVGANREQAPEDDPHDFGTMFVIGTPQHQNDTLNRLRKSPGWRHVKYRAADFDAGIALWPERYSIAALLAIQATDALTFSREYQMDPRDDASSLFPYGLTGEALYPGAGFIHALSVTQRTYGEYVLFGGDLAVSEAVGADYTVLIVALYNRITQKRRVLWACREKGLDFKAMVRLIRTVCKDFNVDIGVVEQNGFQRWLHQHLATFPETNTRVFGHNTGVEKQNLADGVPGLKLALQNHLWEVPDGRTMDGTGILDAEAATWVGHWRAELQAFGFVDGKLQGSGEHDDTVMASWFLERAVRMVEAHQDVAGGDTVYGEDVGINRVHIGAD
jgi:hypothetical protein